EVLFGLGEGLALRILGAHDRDHRATVDAGTLAVAALIR
ncbi:MAG: TetR/AcrR family transcriptional regulator, partial [Conexibacter sp.]|nr:TetR/AcrR family transcriptional regulator [Conexibacter sp.]